MAEIVRPRFILDTLPQSTVHDDDCFDGRYHVRRRRVRCAAIGTCPAWSSCQRIVVRYVKPEANSA